jgi:hypothetical protein
VLPPGPYKIGACDRRSAVKFYPQDADVADDPWPRRAVSGIDSRSRGGRGGGYRLDRASGVPLPQITVSAYDTGFAAGSAATGADGRYSMTLNPGSWKFVAGDPTRRYAVSPTGMPPASRDCPSLASGQTSAAAHGRFAVRPSRTTCLCRGGGERDRCQHHVLQTDVGSTTRPRRRHLGDGHIPAREHTSVATGVRSSCARGAGIPSESRAEPFHAARRSPELEARILSAR